jgi:acetyl-CoA carboxylase carboxyltransferase component
MKKLIALFVDDGYFFELKASFARSMITCFARFDGRPVGIIANQPLIAAGVIDCNAAEKAARFIRFCDAFDIPLVSFMDTPAYMIGIEEEQKGIIYRGAKLLHAYSEATVPKITIIVRKAYAGAYVAMGSRYLGADQIFSWPIAEIVSVAPETAAGVIFRREIMEAENPEEVREERLKEYYDKFVNPYNAAARQDVDDIIEPVETREKIIQAMEMLNDKVVKRPWKKHGNIPL